MGLGRLLVGMAFLVFALSLAPGMSAAGWARWTLTFRRRGGRPLARPEAHWCG